MLSTIGIDNAYPVLSHNDRGCNLIDLGNTRRFGEAVMDLWFDPSRQVIVDKTDWMRPFWFCWVAPYTVWWLTENFIQAREAAWLSAFRLVIGRKAVKL